MHPRPPAETPEGPLPGVKPGDVYTTFKEVVKERLRGRLSRELGCKKEPSEPAGTEHILCEAEDPRGSSAAAWAPLAEGERLEDRGSRLKLREEDTRGNSGNV